MRRVRSNASKRIAERLGRIVETTGDGLDPSPVVAIRKLGGQLAGREMAVTLNRMRYKPTDGNVARDRAHHRLQTASLVCS